jgi:signal transduction histidine kinase
LAQLASRLAVDVTVTSATTLDVSLLNLVAHEMRAPIAVLKGHLSMLRDGSLNDPVEAMEVMEAKAEELESLTEILVTAARLESTDLPRELDMFDVAEAVDVAVQNVQPRARLEQATVDVYAAGRQLWIMADRQHVARVLTNLLNNALSYSSRPASVAVEIRDLSPVEVAVHDGGIGIPPEYQGRIFERFSRFVEPGAARASGLGLGLSISRDLAELNGGELVLERSAPGGGSTFVLRLPLATR